MNHSARFSESESVALGAEAPRSERQRYLEALAVFEDIHQGLKDRAAATAERRALEGLDAVLGLIAPDARTGRKVDLAGFGAFRGSIEALQARSPEARALTLFEASMKEMLAAAPDFDDLPDEEETGEAEEPAASHEEAGPEVSSAQDAVEAHEPEHAAEATAAHDDEVETAQEESAPAEEAAGEDEPSERADSEPADSSPETAEDEAAHETADDDAEESDDETRERIVALEAELAAARAELAA